MEKRTCTNCECFEPKTNGCAHDQLERTDEDVNTPTDCARFEGEEENPYYPFASELEWLNYNNQHTELICDMIINWDGKGVCGSSKLQKIKEVYREARLLLRQ